MAARHYEPVPDDEDLKLVGVACDDSVISVEEMSLGERLHRRRVGTDLTLDDVSVRTRIKRNYLEAFEMMDSRGLPSRAYAVGYLRIYADFLGLNGDECVQQFEMELECEPGRIEPMAPQERSRIKLPRGLVGIVFILGCGLGVAGLYGNYVTRSEPFAEAPSALDTPMIEKSPLIELELDARPVDRTAIWGGLPDARGVDNIVLEATSHVDIEVRDASGRILAVRELKPGEVYRVRDEPGLTISTNGDVLVRAVGRGD